MGEAILYYSKSQRLHHAIRLAKEHGFDQQVMTMSLQASPQIMIQSAIYFEKKGKLDKSVQLYSRGGNKRRAMEIAMRHNLSHMIEDISAGVGDGDDPEVMKNSVDYLMQNGQYDKAVEIMISLGNMEDALGVAEMRNVEVKEELVMKLIPKAEATAHSKQ
jgi:intraflagellar transport protein 140